MGSILQALLSVMGLHVECEQCKKLCAEMDIHGPSWCFRNRRIIVDAIQRNASQFGYGGRRLVFGAWCVFMIAYAIARIRRVRPLPAEDDIPPPAIVHETPEATFHTCPYRGAVLREMEHSCCANPNPVKVSVFDCAKFGECAMEVAVVPRVCAACTAWNAPVILEPPKYDHPSVSAPHSSPIVSSIDQWRARRRARDEQNGLTVQMLREHGDEPDLTDGAIDIRNLIYHMCPLKRSRQAWENNAKHIARRLGIFNGRRLVTIATGDDCDDPADVKAIIGQQVEYLEIPNHDDLREQVTFLSMLHSVASTNPREMTFYAHSKGVTHPWSENTTVHLWTDLMYEICLDYVALAERKMSKYAMAGAFKRIGKQFFGSESSWHYNGTFFWFRHDAVFTQPTVVRRSMWEHRYGVEAWPGEIFRNEQGGCLFLSGEAGRQNMYSMYFVNDDVLPRLDQWRQRHAHLKRAGA